jgi:hypothetical protein
MVLLDGTIVLVALPSIGADLGFSEQGLQWVLSGSRPSRFPSRATKGQTVRRVMVRFKVRADQAATNEQVGGCDHPRAERNQR